MEKWRDKYENLVKKTLKEFENSVSKAQEISEKNVAANEVYIKELKSKLVKSQRMNKELKDELEVTRKRLGKMEEHMNDSSSKRRKSSSVEIVEDIPPTSAIQKRLEFLETLTCLNVHTSGDLPVYHCTLDDGQLMGHEFKLEYDNDVFEYTYTPVNPAPSLKDTDDLSEVLCFPDYMLPRFLIKLLSATYEDNTSVSHDIVSDD